MANPKQKYSIHRDGELMVSDCGLLCAATKFVGVDARNENSAGRSAFYTVTGTLGFKRTGVMHKGKVRWE